MPRPALVVCPRARIRPAPGSGEPGDCGGVRTGRTPSERATNHGPQALRPAS